MIVIEPVKEDKTPAQWCEAYCPNVCEYECQDVACRLDKKNKKRKFMCVLIQQMLKNVRLAVLLFSSLAQECGIEATRGLGNLLVFR